MIVSYSLPGITRAGSKGMISARNIKAPHCVVRRHKRLKDLIVQTCVKKKKEKQPWKRVEFLSGDKSTQKKWKTKTGWRIM